MLDKNSLVAKLAECIQACNYCFAACLEEEDVKMMTECIKLDRECAEICGMALQFIQDGKHGSKEVLDLCAETCTKCADECGKHHYDHCQECAKVCKECAEACKSI